MLLALRRFTSPSIVLLRRVTELSPDEHVELLLANLSAVTNDLDGGAIVSLAPDHLRAATSPSADAAGEHRGSQRLVATGPCALHPAPLAAQVMGAPRGWPDARPQRHRRGSYPI